MMMQDHDHSSSVTATAANASVNAHANANAISSANANVGAHAMPVVKLVIWPKPSDTPLDIQSDAHPSNVLPCADTGHITKMTEGKRREEGLVKDMGEPGDDTKVGDEDEEDDEEEDENDSMIEEFSSRLDVSTPFVVESVQTITQHRDRLLQWIGG